MMEITNIRTVLYEYPLDRPIGDVHAPKGISHSADLAVFLETNDSDLIGVSIGLAGCAEVIDQYGELLIGEDPRAVRHHWNKMVAKSFKLGTARAAKGAIAALDCALWDLRAKAHGVPLWKELGGITDTVPAYASGLDTPLSDEALVDFYESMAKRGITAGKLKVGRDPESDRRRLEQMRDALAVNGADPQAMIDANEFWSPKQAVQRIQALEEEFQLMWVEEPVSRTDYTGLRRVSNGTRAPVATGENLNIAQEYVPLLRDEAVDVVQLGVLTSGVTGALQVAELAASFDRPVTVSGCPGNHMAHLAAALPHHTMMEVSDIGREKVLIDPPKIVGGEIALGKGAGSGITFDRDVLSDFETNEVSEPTLGSVYSQAPDTGLVGRTEPFSSPDDDWP